MRLVTILVALTLASPSSADVTVFAAASLKGALDDVAAAWADATDDTAAISYAGSSVLARQIQAGAPADVFISANVAWMNVLEDEGLLVDGTRSDLLGNALVLVASPQAADTTLADLPEALDDGRLAMALYDAVPAGIYGRESLSALGLWDDLSDRVAQTDNVRSALALVATGEAPYGVVYATDALAEPRLRVVATFPAGSHPEIVYPVAAVIDGDVGAARAFVAFLQGPEADAAFLRHGFILR